MRHRVAGRKLGRPTDHRMALYRNLVTDVLRHEAITTTEAKAKEIRPMIEKLVTRGKTDSVYSRRLAAQFLYDRQVVRKLFEVYGPRYETRPGGYVRITKMAPRRGDGAAMARIEMVS